MKLAIIGILQELFSVRAKKFYASYFLKYWKKNANVYSKKRDHTIFPRTLFLPVPIINNKYLANALKKAGYKADTLMTEYYSINDRLDFDLYFDDIKSKFKSSTGFKIAFAFGAHEDYLNYVLFDYCVQNYDVFAMPFSGGILSFTPLKYNEAQLLQMLGCKTITLAYGADYFRYSTIIDPAYRHTIIANYPDGAKNEAEIRKNYDYWVKHTDILMGMMATDGLGRWDLLPVNYITIDTNLWKAFAKRSIENTIRITHSPNHRYVKGTEFIIDAVRKLKECGLPVELILIENKTNEEVRFILQNESDIHIEQLVFSGYALSAIEAMACGIPVITNLESEHLTRVLRRYSFLNECPAVSASPESVLSILNTLVLDQNLRTSLGEAGRKYVEKYHSDHTSQETFKAIAEKIWFNKQVDLMSYFHPLNPAAYNNRSPRIEHPLFENRIQKIKEIDSRAND